MLTPTRATYLHKRHVHSIHIWPLLPVDLDADKELVEDLRNLLALKGLTLHDMAPVTGRVAHRQKNWLVFRFGFLHGFAAPGVPAFPAVLVLITTRMNESDRNH